MKFLKKVINYILFNIAIKVLDSNRPKTERRDRCFWCAWFWPYVDNGKTKEIDDVICLCYKNADNKLTGDINPRGCTKCKWYKSRIEQIWNLKYKEIEK